MRLKFYLLSLLSVLMMISVSCKDQKEEKQATPVENQTTSQNEYYGLKSISFDLRSLVALNMMNKENVQKFLEEYGWTEYERTEVEDPEKPDSDPQLISITYSNENENWKIDYFDGVEEGFIEFKTSSNSVDNQMTGNIKGNGYKYLFESKDSDSSVELYQILKNDTINYPVFMAHKGPDYFSDDIVFRYSVKKLPKVNQEK